MKLDPVENAPSWLKQHPQTKVYWIDIYRSDKFPNRIQRSLKETVSKLRAKRLGEELISEWGTVMPTSTPTISDVGNEVLKIQSQNRKGTYAHARTCIARIKELVGSMPVNEMTEGKWLVVKTRLFEEKPKWSFGNINKHMTLVMNHAYRHGYLQKPWKFKFKKKDKYKGRILTDSEKSKLLNSASYDLKDQLIFAMTMGMRLREHLLLSWDQVNFNDGTITLEPKHTKTKKGRIIKASDQAIEVLNRRYETTDSDWVFPSRLDRDKPTFDNKTAWVACKRRANIPGRLRYHDLRHTFLTECAKLIHENKLNVALVCEYAGLSIRVFETTYLHLTHEDTKGVSKMIVVKLG